VYKRIENEELVIVSETPSEVVKKKERRKKNNTHTHTQKAQSREKKL